MSGPRRDSRKPARDGIWGKWTPKGLMRVAKGGGGQTARLDQRRVYILPTRYGMLFGAMLLVMLVGSLNYGSNLGFLYTFLLSGVGLASILETWRNLLGLEIHGARAEPVFAGHSAWFEIELGNSRQGSRPGIELGRKGETPSLTDLGPESRVLVRLEVPTQRRGLVTLGRLTAATRYPVGLLRAWGYVELSAECLVYPKPADTRALPPGQGIGRDELGVQGRGADDFAGLRNYRPGDSPKHVYWKLAARGGELVTKQFGGSRGDSLWLDWEQTAGDDESRLSLICRWVLLASEAGLSYGLRLPGIELAPASSDEHRVRCLNSLARYGISR